MAQKSVQLIIGRLLTDEELRERFLVASIETLTSFREIGLDLTDVEIEALACTDRELWRSGAAWIDSRLQRCALGRRHQL